MKRFFLAVLLTGLTAFSLFASGENDLPLLLDSEAVQAVLEDDSVVIVDFARKGEDYDKGHIEGAVYLPRESVWQEVNGVAGMFPGVDTAVKALESVGLSRDKTIIIYDGIGNLWASRLFWTLEYLGHDDVHLLDGGIQGWTAAGYALSSDPVVPEAAEFKVDLNPDILVSKEDILNGLDGEDHRIVDTRSLKEYTGEDPRSARGGHIPGAVHIEWSQNVYSEERYFLSTSELTELYDLNGVDRDQSVVTLCQTGVRGAHTYFVLRNLGYSDVALYDGSWAEWGNANDVPIAEGDA